MSDNKISRPKKFDLQNREERQTFDSKHLKKASGSYEFGPNSNSTYEEVSNMSEFIERKEFEQFEKRMDEKLNALTGKIDELPSRIEDKTKYQISEMKNTQMKWFVATIIAIIGLAGRIFGIY